MKKIFNPDKKIILIFLAIDIICILAVLGIILVSSNRVGRMFSEMAAERWENSKLNYSEVSLYYSDDAGITENDIQVMRSTIYKKLMDDSYVSPEDKNRVWIDSYCAHTVDTIRKDSNSVSVDVYLVGGDFFMIHPIPLRGGSYLDLENDDYNQILLDENVAWNLFGSNDIAGMKLWIGDRVFTITGVVAVSEDEEEVQAYGDSDCVYIPFKAYAKKEKNLMATNYQAVLPNPIKNYAKNIVAEASGINFKTDEEMKKSRSILNFSNIELVENTDRYKLPSLLSMIESHKYIDMRVNSVEYPYWENVARYIETRMIRNLNICVVLSIIPIFSLIYVLLWLLYRRKAALKPFIFVKNKISDKVEDKKVKRYEEKQQKKREEEARLAEERAAKLQEHL